MSIERSMGESMNCLIDTLNQAVKREGEKIFRLAVRCVESLKKGGKLLIFGNGGSAADAQHVAAEFVNRFKMERAPLPAIALTTDSSVLTSIGNDYDFRQVFSKQVRALARKGDIVMGISTSGTSPNVVTALEEAKAIGAYTVLLAGQGGHGVEDAVDMAICVPSRDTPRIQEVHLFMEHVFCDLVEQLYFGVRCDRSH